MNDIDELTRYLHARADAAELGHTPVRAIARRGAQRKARRRAMATAGVLATGSIAGVVAVQALSSGPAPTRITTATPVPDDPTTPSSAATPSPAPLLTAPETAPPTDAVSDQPFTLTDSPLVWNPITVGSAEAVTSIGVVGDPTAATVQPDGSFAQVSSASGRSPTIAPALYRSSDAITWAEDPAGIFDGRLSPLLVDGDRLYTVSTGAAGAAIAGDPKDYFSVTSDDGGDTWQSTRLDLDTAAWATEQGVGATGLHSRVSATNGHDVLLAGVASVVVDASTYAERLGLDVTTLSQYREEMVARVATPIDCDEVSDLFTQAEAEAGGASMLPPGGRVGDGACVRWGAELGRYGPADLGLSPEATAAIGGIPVLFHAVPGEGFERIDPPALPDGFDVFGLQLMGNDEGFVLYVTTSTPSAPEQTTLLAWSSADGRTWAELPAVPTDCGTTPLGFLDGQPAVGRYTCGGGLRVLVLRNGAWSGVSLAEVVAPDATDVAMFTAVGERGVATVVRAGQPAATPTDSPEGRFEPGTLRWVLLYSPDGASWSRTELSDLTDMTDRQVTAVRVTDTNVLVSVMPRTDGGPDTALPDTTILVGTLA